MKNLFGILTAFFLLPLLSSCQTWNIGGTKINLGSNSGQQQSNSLTTDQVIQGLKEALKQGTGKGSDQLSKHDGYFGNLAVKVLMPPEAKDVEDKLRQFGFGSLVDNAIESMNRAAEAAAPQAKGIFVNAITSMTFSDAWAILKGGNDAATNYLKQTCTASLTNVFKPVIQGKLDEVGATKYWTDVFTRYNKLPLVKPVNTDLPSYVTQKALDGLFYTIAQEELKIRQDPMGQASAILQQVFGSLIHH